MPVVATLLELTPDAEPAIEDIEDDSDDSVPRIRAEAVKLFLPSSLPEAYCQGEVMKSLQSKEFQLRSAQANDALVDIRRLRRVITGTTRFKQLNTSGAGQKPNIRVRTLFSGF